MTEELLIKLAVNIFGAVIVYAIGHWHGFSRKVKLMTPHVTPQLTPDKK